jgi:hypothetical protein
VNYTSFRHNATKTLASPQQSPSKSNVDEQTAPRSSRAAWPYRYACDMAKGFRHFQELRDQGMPPQMAFEQSFIGAQWKRSTFSDNFRVWDCTPTKEMSAAVGKGRGIGGEWNTLRKKYGKGKQR